MSTIFTLFSHELIVGMSNPLIRDRHPDQRSILRALLFEISLTNSGRTAGLVYCDDIFHHNEQGSLLGD